MNIKKKTSALIIYQNKSKLVTRQVSSVFNLWLYKATERIYALAPKHER